MDASGRRHRGLLTGDDMARWRASLEAPITYDYHGYTVAKCGPWSQGPLFLQQLSLLRDIDIAAMDPTAAAVILPMLLDTKAGLAFAYLQPQTAAAAVELELNPVGAGSPSLAL